MIFQFFTTAWCLLVIKTIFFCDFGVFLILTFFSSALQQLRLSLVVDTRLLLVHGLFEEPKHGAQALLIDSKHYSTGKQNTTNSKIQQYITCTHHARQRCCRSFYEGKHPVFRKTKTVPFELSFSAGDPLWNARAALFFVVVAWAWLVRPQDETNNPGGGLAGNIKRSLKASRVLIHEHMGAY